jgi:hypothetical protein
MAVPRKSMEEQPEVAGRLTVSQVSGRNPVRAAPRGAPGDDGTPGILLGWIQPNRAKQAKHIRRIRLGTDRAASPPSGMNPKKTQPERA